MGRDALTYAELDRAANRIVHALLDRLGPGDDPGSCCCWIYVPLDPAHPAPRLTEAIGDSGARLVLTAGARNPVGGAPLLRSSDAGPARKPT